MTETPLRLGSYREEQTWPLTSDTTLYTGVNQSTLVRTRLLRDVTASQTTPVTPRTRTVVESQHDGDGDGPVVEVSWATQTHTCRFQVVTEDEASDVHQPQSSSRSSSGSTLQPTIIPNDSDPLVTMRRRHRRLTTPIPLVSRPVHSVGMGRSVDHHDNDNDDLSSHGTMDERKPPPNMCVGYSTVNEWEALALLDASTVSHLTTLTTTEESDLVSPPPPPPPTTTMPSSLPPESSHPPPPSTGLSSSDSWASLSVIATAPPPPTTTTTTSAASTAHSRHVRSSSYASLSEASLTSITTKPSSESTLAAALHGGGMVGDAAAATHHHKSQASFDAGAATTTTASGSGADLVEMTVTLDDPTLRAAVVSSQLVLRRAHDNKITHSTTTSPATIEFATMLDFRPLAVTAFCYNCTTMDQQAHSVPLEPWIMDNTIEQATDACFNDAPVPVVAAAQIGVWLGSADSCKLYCFVPTTDATGALLVDDSGNEQSLVPVALDNSAFHFATPVMAISYANADRTTGHIKDTNTTSSNSVSTSCLTVSCQDGTIRLIAFTFHRTMDGRLAFANVRTCEVIVDGPIVCVHETVVHQNDKTFVSIAAGSLCGYATELSVDLDSMAVHGPFMIANALWDSRLTTEDSVLAIHATRDTIVLGTLAGRCLVYHKHCDETARAERVTPLYQRYWECQLPHPVHGVTLLLENGTGHRRLVVTTRRSVHLFRRMRLETPVSSHETTIAGVALATKERLLKILQANSRTVDPI